MLVEAAMERLRVQAGPTRRASALGLEVTRPKYRSSSYSRVMSSDRIINTF